MADFGARAGAFIMDYLLIYLILFLFLFVAFRPLAGLPLFGDLALFAFPIPGGLALFLFFWARAQSPGKAALGLHVVNRDGTPTKMARMLVREVLLKGVVVNIPLALTIVGPFVWYLWPLWDKERRAPHDMILGTRVVRKGRRELREAMP